MNEQDLKNEISLQKKVKIDLKTFLSAFIDIKDKICFRVFHDKDKEVPAFNFSYFLNEFDSFIKVLKSYNLRGYGVFFCVNTGGHSDKDITKINAQFTEMDDDGFDVQTEKIKNFKLSPSIIVKTRRSLHVYWLLKGNPIISLFKPIQMALADYFSGDKVCKNESRFMRLPTFYHNKKEPLEVECIYFHPEIRYTQDELRDALPPLETIKEKRPVDKEQEGLEFVITGCDFIKYCIENRKTLIEPFWHAMITILSVFKGGIAKIHEYSKNYPNYSESETNRKIASFFKSETRPMTCKYINEMGFKCEKYERGECECNSPAGLANKPLNIEGLKEFLKKQNIVGDAEEVIEKLKTFIDRYMFNLDSTIGETFINHTIKSTYGLKGYDVKSLIQYFKEVIKNFSKSIKAEPLSSDVAQWYRPSSSGLTFMPYILAKDLADNVPVIFMAESHHEYQNGVYKPINKYKSGKIIQEKMLPEYCKSSQIADCEYQWRILTNKDIKEVNPNPYIINLKNGLYDVLNKKLLHHTPDYLSNIQLNCSYDENADCPLFKKYLFDVMEGDEGQINLIKEILGYCLIPITLGGKCMVFVGAANAGKSILLSVINEILIGIEYVSNVAWQNLSDRFKTAELYGKLANIFADLPTQNITESGIFKSLVTSDIITVEKKNKDPFSFKSTCKLIFSCNELPRNLADVSEGFFRRLIIIRFSKVINEAKKDVELLDKLRNEADGILNFALEGLNQLIEHKFKFSETEKTKKELDKYREESDSCLAFINECCSYDEKETSSTHELYRQYKIFCDEYGYKACGRNKLTNRIKTVYPSCKSYKKDNSWRIKGIKYDPSKPSPEDEIADTDGFVEADIDELPFA